MIDIASGDVTLIQMGSTFYSLHCHVVFSTKERRPLLRADWRGQLHQYLGGTIRGLGGVPQAIGGVDDHVHLLIGLRTIDAPANMVRELKKASSLWVAQHYDPLFAWQEGYAIFSISKAHCPAVSQYIARQEEHHAKFPFLDELKRLLVKNGVTYDPKYLA